MAVDAVSAARARTDYAWLLMLRRPRELSLARSVSFATTALASSVDPESDVMIDPAQAVVEYEIRKVVTSRAEGAHEVTSPGALKAHARTCTCTQTWRKHLRKVQLEMSA